MSLSAPLFAAAAAAAPIVLLTVARRSRRRPHRHVVLDENADPVPNADPDGTAGQQPQESRQTQIRHMLGEPDAHDQRLGAVPADHLVEAGQRWMTDGGTSADDRRWTL